MKSNVLKGYFFTLTVSFCVIGAKAQTTWDTLPWRSYADYKLQLLNKNNIQTGILYDRVFPIANVDDFGGIRFLPD
jgi:hypothetical protein